MDWNQGERNERTVGKVFQDDHGVNLATVRTGYVWWYRKYADEQLPVDQVLHEDPEDKARAKRAGLWQGRDPVPRWGGGGSDTVD